MSLSCFRYCVCGRRFRNRSRPAGRFSRRRLPEAFQQDRHRIFVRVEPFGPRHRFDDVPYAAESVGRDLLVGDLA